MKSLLAAATFVAFTAPAFAQVPTTPADAAEKATEKFALHDTDKSGALSIDEVKVADATVTATDFAQFDADQDKALSQDEFESWLEAKAPTTSAPGQ